LNTKKLYTISIALPGSIIDNAQSIELKTYLAGQVTLLIQIKFCSYLLDI